MTWFRLIYRVPEGAQTLAQPFVGWWLECTRYGEDEEPLVEHRHFGPFSTLQEAEQFRDADFPIN